MANLNYWTSDSETDPVSKMLCSFRTSDSGQSPETQQSQPNILVSSFLYFFLYIITEYPQYIDGLKHKYCMSTSGLF
jgi:hypothetical protein